MTGGTGQIKCSRVPPLRDVLCDLCAVVGEPMVMIDIQDIGDGHLALFCVACAHNAAREIEKAAKEAEGRE